jgi:hypothetical protein
LELLELGGQYAHLWSLANTQSDRLCSDFIMAAT